MTVKAKIIPGLYAFHLGGRAVEMQKISVVDDYPLLSAIKMEIGFYSLSTTSPPFRGHRFEMRNRPFWSDLFDGFVAKVKSDAVSCTEEANTITIITDVVEVLVKAKYDEPAAPPVILENFQGFNRSRYLLKEYENPELPPLPKNHFLGDYMDVRDRLIVPAKFREYQQNA